MGLAYRQVGWVRVEQQRALLGLHAAAGASWVTRGLLLVALLVSIFSKSSPERMLHVLTKEPAKGLPPQPS